MSITDLEYFKGCGSLPNPTPPPTTNIQWYINSEGYWQLGDYKTNVSAYGLKGDSPRIIDGVWWVGNTNTGVVAEGQDGHTPYVGVNGNWWIGDTDTGVSAEPEDLEPQTDIEIFF